jgi:hypothetical protein
MKPLSIPKMKGVEPTHTNLRAIGEAWLRKREMRSSVVISDLFVLDAADGFRGERADVIGWFGQYSTVIECKTSRKDFFDNQKKPWLGMGRWRYFLVPKDLVQPSEVPSDYGLLEWDGTKVYTIIEAPDREDYDVYHEVELLLTAIRCMRNSGGIRVTYYDSPVNVATMGIEPLDAHNAPTT